MSLAFFNILAGLALLVWSADRFVEGAAAVARHLGMPQLLIGMVIIGFGTSAPEMVVSALAAFQGNPGLALGNAYGSNIANIALILGLTALLRPIPIAAGVLRKELPLLTAVTALAAWQLHDREITRWDAVILLLLFAGVMGWNIAQGMRYASSDANGGGEGVDTPRGGHPLPMPRAVGWLVVGLVVLIASSRLLVWGAVEVAQGFGVSDLIIGLTIVAVGTSLPELASAIAATRQGEHELALGNVLGSNLFNTLAVVGIAGAIHPMAVEGEVFSRDLPVMAGLTLSLFAMGYGSRGDGHIDRWEGGLLLACYVGYTAYLGSLLAASPGSG